MNRIRSLREEIGMSQKELATRLGVSGGGVISKYEKGHNTLSEDTLRQLSNIFGVSVDYILGLSDERGRGSSVSRPALAWDALALVDAVDALPDHERSSLLACAKAPDALSLARQYLQLSPKYRRRAVEYMEMLKVFAAAKGPD